MNRSLGISIYPEKMDEKATMEYIKLAAKYGFTRIFTCLLSVKGSFEDVKNEYGPTLKLAKELGFEVILDVSPSALKALDLTIERFDAFKELHATGVRLDAGYDGLKESLLTYNNEEMAIEANMSNDTFYIDNIMSHEPNRGRLYGCHNFYPQKETGLNYEYFLRCSRRFKKHNLRTAAFVNSSAAHIGPWELDEGYCTLEAHRNLPITSQATHLWATNLIDDVIIGNAYASEEELAALAELDRYLMQITVETAADLSDVEKTILYDELHYRRGDSNDSAIRSTAIRGKYAQSNIEPNNNKTAYKKGDILIGNNLFSKYKGELQIALTDGYDERKNKVGSIAACDALLIDEINSWVKFTFK